MATLLIAWELGGGTGHMTPHLPVARCLTERGHRVVFALRDLQHAERLLGAAGYSYLQAPTRLHTCPRPLRPVSSYAQILHNVGYYDRDVLLGRIVAWRNLLDLVQPDLLLCDFAPTAMLAAQIDGLPAVRIGAGFWNPPSSTPLPSLVQAAGTRDLAADEAGVLAVVNAALARLERPALGSLGALQRDVPTLLQTFPELDPYRRPDGAVGYFPVDSMPPGPEPCWPAGDGPRLFGYVAGGDYLVPLVQALVELGLPTLLVGNGVDGETTRRLRGTNVAWADGYVDMRRLGPTCRVAVGNAGHSMAINLLCAGIPQLLYPRTLEQQVNAARLQGLGCALPGPGDRRGIIAALRKLLDANGPAVSARRFSASHVPRDEMAPELRIAQAIEARLPR